MTIKLHHLGRIFILLSLTSPFTYANTQVCNTSDIINKIEQRLDKITDYQVTIISTVNNQKPAEMLIASKRPDLLKATIELSDNDKLTIVYDKKYQWIEQANTIYKVDLSKIKQRTPERPFDTDYSLAGGLLSGEDYVGTIKTILSIYDLKASCRGQEITLQGPLNKEKFNQYAKARKIAVPLEEFVKQFANALKNATLSVNKGNYLIDNYNLVGTDQFKVSFKDYNFSPLTPAQLSFTIPEGINPIDITPGTSDALPVPATDNDTPNQ